MGFYRNVNTDIKTFQRDEILKDGDVRKIVLKKTTSENHRYDHKEKHYTFRDIGGLVDFNCYNGDSISRKTYNSSYYNYYTSSELNNYYDTKSYDVIFYKYDDVTREWEVIFEVMSIDAMTGKLRSTRQRHACAQCALREYCNKRNVEIPECKFETVDGSEGNIFFREVEKKLIKETSKEEIDVHTECGYQSSI